MRQRFEQQIKIGTIAIPDVKFPLRSRDELPPILASLQYIFVTPELNEKVFALLEKKICEGKKDTGRTGMSLWHIMVLSVVRHGTGTNWDTLETMANYHTMVRDVMGVNNPMLDQDEKMKISFNRQTIIDNVSLIDEALLYDINQLVVVGGQKLVTKKEGEPLRLKTDSYVLETNVHFPTDLNLLWDSVRKCLDMVKKLSEITGTKFVGWRKIKKLRGAFHGLFRTTSQQVFTGKDEEKKVKAVKKYIGASLKLKSRCDLLIESLGATGIKTNIPVIGSLTQYCKYVTKFCEQIERRILKGEAIPAQEKIYSIFETETEWITKGKLNKKVELGHMLLITTDQYQFIIDYKVMEKQRDHAQVKPLMERINKNMPDAKIFSHSFDKGFCSKDNKKTLKDAQVEHPVLPKKGRLNQKEKAEESQLLFKKLRHAHSAVESNINMLEHHGLNRCMDKGIPHYKRYVGLSVLAYNLHIMGNLLIAQERKKQAILEKQRERYQRQAA